MNWGCRAMGVFRWYQGNTRTCWTYQMEGWVSPPRLDRVQGNTIHCRGNAPTNSHLTTWCPCHMCQGLTGREFPTVPGASAHFLTPLRFNHLCLPVLSAHLDLTGIHLPVPSSRSSPDILLLQLESNLCAQTHGSLGPDLLLLGVTSCLPCGIAHDLINKDSIYIITSFFGFLETSKSLLWLLYPYRYLMTYDISVNIDVFMVWHVSVSISNKDCKGRTWVCFGALGHYQGERNVGTLLPPSSICHRILWIYCYSINFGFWDQHKMFLFISDMVFSWQ